MDILGDDDRHEEYSEIGDKGDIGFLDFEDDKSLKGFDPLNEGPVVISLPFPFINSKPRSVLVGETSADMINIQNTSNDVIELWGIKIYSSNPDDSFILSLMRPPSSDQVLESIQDFIGTTNLEDRVLQSGENLTIWLSCIPKEIGMHISVIHFDLGDERIERVVFLLAEDKVSQALSSDRPYSRAPTRKDKFVVDGYVASHRPPRQHRQAFRYSLPQYPIPKEVREAIESEQIPDAIMEGLNIRNYEKYFSTLINMEEIHLEKDMRAHDMECVTMRKRGNQFLSLEVPGLAERRPSLVYGDFIFAKLASNDPDDSCVPHQGYIYRVEADEIFLKFDETFHQEHRNDDLYHVSFTYNRLNMRRMYQAVQAAEKLGPDLLFPNQSYQRRVIRETPFIPLNSSLNREQIWCVEKILGCKGGSPYVIHGPPGTGKTVTLVEVILQLYRNRRKAQILVCASSNSAADHLLEKLLDKEEAVVKESEIFRLNATSRSYEDIKPDYIRFCYLEELVFKCPPRRALLRYRIIISTYMSASMLYAEGIYSNHFSHILLDEAGQASEPEMMIPLSNLCTRNTVIVLAGDQMQLGPVVYSRQAQTFGLGKSYLERLFEYNGYKDGDENFVMKLVKSYRCHPAILELPSKLFYNSELYSCKDDIEPFEWDELPNMDFPVLFFGIQGCDEREGSNPSWFNRIEASKVVDIIKKLYRDMELTEYDFGVITPYRQQVLKLKKALETMDMPNVKVGSIEQFQGQEKEVVIISTVRSTVKHNDFDRVHSLGFLGNPKRFNVAITRARSLLVIVGNPHIIAKDKHWDKLLRYCTDNSSYQGCPLPQLEGQDYDSEPTGYNSRDDVHGLNYNKAEWSEDPKSVL